MITRELLDKFRRGECTAEELALLKKYLFDQNSKAIESILTEDWENESIPSRGVDSSGQRVRIWDRLVLSRVQNQVFKKNKLSINTGRFTIDVRLVAAVISFCLMGFGGFVVWKKFAETSVIGKQSSGQIIERNDSGRSRTIVLADSSTVVLESRSVLYYPAVFEEGRRLVRLEGKAFFDIKRDTLHPFFVETNSLQIKVLGTSFSVSSFENKPAEVAVVTGKVAVFAGNQQNMLVLEPNEKVIHEKESFSKMLVADPVIVKEEALKILFDFDETPAATVFRALENAYNVNIEFDAEQVKDCSLKARLDNQSLFVKMDMICASLGLEYEVVGTDIKISGVGCHRY